MKQLVQSMRTGAVGVLDVPAPQLRGPGVLVQTAVSLISAGTERATSEFAKASLVDKARSRPDLVKQVLDKVRRDGLAATVEGIFERLDRPAAPGYAAAGTVMAVATDVTELNVGDRVACAGASYATHAEVNYIPRNLVVPIPRRASGESVGFDEAAFTTLGAIALHGVRLGTPQLGDCAVVIGLGVIGLLAVQILRAHGCRVVGVDLDPARCDLSRTLGADRGIGPGEAAEAVAAWTRRLGADLVVVAAAADRSDPAVLAAELAREKGRIVAIGATGLDLPRRTLYQKELSVVVSRSYGPGRYDPEFEERGRHYPLAHVRWTERENMRAFLELVADDRVNVRPLISHRFDIEDGERAYATLESGPTLGILLDYARESAHVAVDSTSTRTPTRPVSAADGPARSGRPRISAIGAGNFARGVLFPLLRRTERATLGTIVTSTGLSARAAADKFGFARCSTSAEDIWTDDDADAVVIATRHDSHTRLVIAALEAGKAVFVEKPLCTTPADLASIVDASARLEAAGQPPFLMVGFNRRFAPAVQAVRARMSTADAPVSIVYRINAGRVPPTSWMADHGEGGGRIVGEVCHFVDACAYLAGSPVTEVSAMRSAAGEEDVVVTLRMQNGSVATIAYLIDGSARLPKERIEVFAGGQSAVIDDFRRVGFNGGGTRSLWSRVLGRQDKGHRAELAAFVDAVAQRRPSPVPLASAVNSTRATFAIRQSIDTNTIVRIS
jgi:predicted dehydrogenase/threonine dehydrogenase-like Zn-dependent dehydrogenase